MPNPRASHGASMSTLEQPSPTARMQRAGLLRYYSRVLLTLRAVFFWGVGLGLVLYLVGRESVAELVMLTAVACLGLLVLHFPILFLLRCPHCARPVTLQTFSPVHPNALEKDPGPEGAAWDRVVRAAARG